MFISLLVCGDSEKSVKTMTSVVLSGVPIDLFRHDGCRGRGKDHSVNCYAAATNRVQC